MSTALRATLHAAVVAGLTISGASAVFADELVELPRDLEIELALSALPKALRDEAAVYVRDPQEGFVLHREGTNGFSTFVGRTSVRFYEADWAYDYPSDQLIPIAYDRVGMAYHAKPWFDLERMRIDGLPPEEAKRTLRQRFRDGTYRAPHKGGLSYMLAPVHRAYMAPAASDEVMTVSFPHYMPYAPHIVPEALGAMDPMGRAGALDHGGEDAGPHGYLYFMAPEDQARAIRKEHAGMLDRLCGLHANWCLPDEAPDNTQG